MKNLIRKLLLGYFIFKIVSLILFWASDLEVGLIAAEQDSRSAAREIIYFSEPSKE